MRWRKYLSTKPQKIPFLILNARLSVISLVQEFLSVSFPENGKQVIISDFTYVLNLQSHKAMPT
jgi:hypothetical protein